jgi:hypothetical protein
MKMLERHEASLVSGGASAWPYPVPGSTPPYVPDVPQPSAIDLFLKAATRDRVE